MVTIFELNHTEVFGDGKHDSPLFSCLSPSIGVIPHFYFDHVDVTSRDYITVKIRLKDREVIEMFPGDWVVISDDSVTVITQPSDKVKKILLGE